MDIIRWAPPFELPAFEDQFVVTVELPGTKAKV